MQLLYNGNFFSSLIKREVCRGGGRRKKEKKFRLSKCDQLGFESWRPWDKISGWVCCVVFVYEGNRERETKAERETESGSEERSSGLAAKPWQRQTGCTILWGRFNYKWCFHSEPSWNPLFFRRSSSPNPQQGSVWPASEVICLAHIACHALWMTRRRHSCPNFAESGANINASADGMLIFFLFFFLTRRPWKKEKKRCGIESGFTEAFGSASAATIYPPLLCVYASQVDFFSTFSANLYPSPLFFF